MNLFIENYAQLLAIAAPLLTLAAMNLLLALGGERGTLLVPSAGAFGLVSRAPFANNVPAAAPPQKPQTPANDPVYRFAA
jgi:hypothetical protein